MHLPELFQTTEFDYNFVSPMITHLLQQSIYDHCLTHQLYWYLRQLLLTEKTSFLASIYISLYYTFSSRTSRRRFSSGITTWIWSMFRNKDNQTQSRVDLNWTLKRNHRTDTVRCSLEMLMVIFDWVLMNDWAGNVNLSFSFRYIGHQEIIETLPICLQIWFPRCFTSRPLSLTWKMSSKT